MEFCVGDLVYLKDADTICNELNYGRLSENTVPFCGHIYIITGEGSSRGWLHLEHTEESANILSPDGRRVSEGFQFRPEWLDPVQDIQIECTALDDFFSEM